MSLKELFQLDPDVVYLNHGSFGACPRPVLEVYQEWQRRLERQPVLFLGRQYTILMAQARQVLGSFLHANADDLVFIPNATHGVNIVARSIDLQPGDEILTSDHEYGACDNAWEYACHITGARYIHQPVKLPVAAQEEIIEQLWQGVTPRTRLIYLSHITSPTALRLPVEAIASRARERGILTAIDGAHAPGQISLDLEASQVDIYFGNLHKWALCPKGAAFLYVNKECQPLMRPLVVSWGYSADQATSTGSRFIDLFQWNGTYDPSAVLSVPSALQFMEEQHWEAVRSQCKTYLNQALQNLAALTGLPPVYPPGSEFYQQMAVAPLPGSVDVASMKTSLYDQYKVEVPLIEWNGYKLARISVQGYNTLRDLETLTTALSNLLSIKELNAPNDKARR